ncbi:D-glucuronyl C5-epimerase family protein [Vibrio alginolyticus]|nr:D-glucuronyl C5-epimerase family protein [Vibrio alginolyticus]
MTSFVNGNLDHYFFNFSKSELLKGGSQKFSFDENGIPLLPHYLKGASEGKHYYPISIGQFALSEYHEYLNTDSKEALSSFMTMANWLLDNQNDDGYWYSNTDMSKFMLDSPWISAMAQGRCISVLIRAYCQTQEEKYLVACKKAVETFDPELNPSKMVTVLSDEEYFYQEYPGKVDSYVLNGAIFALWGLIDYFKVTGDDYSYRLFEKGVNGVISKLPDYDLGYWSCYDRYHIGTSAPLNTCTAHYHNIHIKQMQVMYNLTSNKAFSAVANRWQSVEKRSNLLLAYLSKFKAVVYRG